MSSHQAICTSMKMIEEYKNSYDVTNRELYIDILNAHRKNRVAKEWAIEQFKNEDNATQINIYNTGITISESNIAVAKIQLQINISCIEYCLSFHSPLSSPNRSALQ